MADGHEIGKEWLAILDAGGCCDYDATAVECSWQAMRFLAPQGVRLWVGHMWSRIRGKIGAKSGPPRTVVHCWIVWHRQGVIKLQWRSELRAG